jgi:hypothetical protein
LQSGEFPIAGFSRPRRVFGLRDETELSSPDRKLLASVRMSDLI